VSGVRRSVIRRPPSELSAEGGVGPRDNEILGRLPDRYGRLRRGGAAPGATSCNSGVDSRTIFRFLRSPSSPRVACSVSRGTPPGMILLRSRGHSVQPERPLDFSTWASTTHEAARRESRYPTLGGSRGRPCGTPWPGRLVCTGPCDECNRGWSKCRRPMYVPASPRCRAVHETVDRLHATQ